MCGLFGMMGEGITNADNYIIDELMLLSSTRGIDGTGLVVGRFRGGPKPISHKVVGDPFYWRFACKGKDGGLYSITNEYAIGHTRWKSAGGTDADSMRKCVQPFVYDKCIVTHNGTINYDSYEPFFNDSHRITSKINETAPKDIQSVFTELDGIDASYAFVWYNRSNQTMNFLRNSYRSLFFAVNKKRSVFYWASEKRMLDFALANEEVDIFYFEPNRLYTTDCDKFKSYRKMAEWMSSVEIKPPKPKLIHIGKKLNDTLLTEGDDYMGESQQDLLEIPWMRDIEESKKRKVNEQ